MADEVVYAVPFSFSDYEGDGATQAFAVPFPFIHRDHVSFLVNGEPVEFSWISDGLVEAAAAPDDSLPIRIRRLTPAETMMVVFTSPANFRPEQINNAFRQLLYIIQEAFDYSLQALELARQMSNLHAEVVEMYDEIGQLWEDMQALWGEMQDLQEDIEALYDDVEELWLNARWEIAVNVPYRVGRNETIFSYQFQQTTVLAAGAPGSAAWALSPGSEAPVKVELYHSTTLGSLTKIADVDFAAESIDGVIGEISEDVVFEAGEFLIGRMADSTVDDDFRHWGLLIATHRPSN